jgi:hypothetical protein
MTNKTRWRKREWDKRFAAFQSELNQLAQPDGFEGEFEHEQKQPHDKTRDEAPISRSVASGERLQIGHFDDASGRPGHCQQQR